MRKITLKPYKTLHVGYNPVDVPVIIKINSSDVIDVYIVDQLNNEAYKKNNIFESLINLKSRINYELTTTISSGVFWYLIIANNNEKKVTVKYDVYVNEV